MKKTILLKLFALVAAMMCALGVQAQEAYACYTSTNTTLTFYYDNLRSTRPGTTYDLKTGYGNPGWRIDGSYVYVTKVVFMSTFANARPTSTYYWFNDMQRLESITGLSYLNTSEVTNMSWMFSNCNNLGNLDVSHFNTSKVTDVRGMFNNCSSLTSLDVSSFNTSKVTELDYVFYGCRGLTKLDLTSFNTSQVTKMNYMFYGCSSLRTIYAGEEWSTAAVIYSTDMFRNCSSLVGGQGTFYNAAHVDAAYAHLDGGPSNPGYLTDKNAIEAYACYSSLSGTLTFYYDTLRGTRTGTTYNMPSIATITPGWHSDGTYANVTKVVFDFSFADYRPTYTYGWFESMSELESIAGMSNLKTDNVIDMRYMFRGCSKLTSLDVSHFNTANVTLMNYMFYGCTGLTNLDLSSFNTSKVTNMASMFSICLNLTAICVGEGWSTAAVTNSTDMFKTCTNLVGGQGTTYDANHVDKAYAHIDGGPSNPGYFTVEGTQAYACYTPGNTTLTFYYDTQRGSRPGTIYDLNMDDRHPQWYNDNTCRHVTQVKFDASFANARPTTTYEWFFGMENLLSIWGMNNLNTSMVTNMNGMFGNCSVLPSLDLSHFNTSKVTDMGFMFGYCNNLTSLDLSSFNTSKVTTMYSMFVNCSNLRTITVGSDWGTAAVTNSTNMFNNDTSLVGGQGTIYDDSNPKDKTYAHLDGGPSNPGYFTAAGTEAYACYTSSNTTLTFYYDTQRASRPGTSYNLNTGENDTGWKTDGTNANVTQVVFDPSFAGARPKTTYLWFYLMGNLQTITGIEYLNTSEVTDMAHMFNSCSKLTSIDVSHFNTSKVTEMRIMFYNCSGLTSLDLSSFNTSNVTSMFNMFGNCSNLRTIYVGDGWSTAAVTNSASMFASCTSLVGGQGTTYDASNPKDKTYAHIDGGPSDPGYFTAEGAQPWTEPEAYACYTPSNTTLTFYYDGQRSARPGTTYDLNTDSDNPSWKTDGINANVTQVVFDPSFANARPTSTFNWFYEMKNLLAIEGIEYLNTSDVTRMSQMFYKCEKLSSLDVSHFNTSKVTTMWYMFGGSKALASLDMSSFNTSKVTSMGYMFYNCNSLHTIYVGEGWSTAAVTTSASMFASCTSLVGGKGTTYDANHVDKAYAHIDGGPSNPGYFSAVSTDMRGDVNGDTLIDINDVTLLIDVVLGKNVTYNAAGADCNVDGGDGTIDINDVTTLINRVLTGNW